MKQLKLLVKTEIQILKSLVKEGLSPSGLRTYLMEMSNKNL